MHSSRMRTGSSLTVCQSLLPGGVCSRWGVSAPSGGVSAPGGGVCSGDVCSWWGVYAPRGCLRWGVSAPGGVCSRGCLLQGVCLLWGGVCSEGVGMSALVVVVVVSQHALRQTPPLGQNHRRL